jgi:hypothetical protein
MKLGTETGSVVNHLMSRGTNGEPEPVVGMGCTTLYWTDRKACTIVDVIPVGSRLILAITEDKAVRVDSNGMSECQEYRYETDPRGARMHFRKNRKGLWRGVWKNEAGRWVECDGPGLQIGVRRAYHDFSF